jgi:glycosyltransferase involved in cell wall biosynthesis
MRVWLLQDGENLPVQEGARPMRMWRLATALAARGHEVTWWASTFSHQRKKLLFSENQRISGGPGITLRLLMAGAYVRNVSFRRYRHHKRLARKFRDSAPNEQRPDVIVTSFPQTDLAYEAVAFGKARGIPTLVDIRDPWPDVFVDKAPRFLKPFSPWLLRGAYAKTAYLLSEANQWVAVSEGFEKWAGTRAGANGVRPCRVFYIGGKRVSDLAPQALPPALKWLENGAADNIVFAFVGTFGRSYDLETVIEVARLCEQRGPARARFVIAGDGEKRDALTRLGRRLGNLLLPGWLSSDDIDYLLSHARVGLVPCISLPDTVPNKIFEYLGAGLPVFSSLVGEVDGILSRSDAGFSYRVGDVEGLYELVRRVVTTPDLLDRLTRNARVLFDQGLCVDRIYADYAKFVESLAEREGRKF